MTWLAIVALNAMPMPSMEEGMQEYFNAELGESFVFMAAGAASLGTAVPLFLEHGAVGRPMSIPLALFGVIDLVLGVGLFARTPGQLRSLSEQLRARPSEYQQAEARRMRSVMNGFQIYRLFELTVATTGAFLAGIGHVRSEPTLTGVGLGLLIEAGLLLVLDHFAESRGARYATLLADFRP